MHPMMLDQDTALLVRQGRKTQRRWVMPWPSQFVLPGIDVERMGASQRVDSSGEPTGRWGWYDPEGNFYPAPVRGPGADLYVREAWQLLEPAVADVAVRLGIDVAQDKEGGAWAVCRSAVASLGCTIGTTVIEKWRAAIHCPTWAATQWVRVEQLYLHRLTKIDSAEVVSEGLQDLGDAAATLAAFIPFWDARNPSAKWETEPMVAAVRFRSMSREEAATP